MRLQAAGAAAAMTGEAVKLAPADADVLGEIVERAATPPQKSSLASRLKRLRTAGAAVMAGNTVKLEDEPELDEMEGAAPAEPPRLARGRLRAAGLAAAVAAPEQRAWDRFVMP